jgi:hypothetical protein
VKKHEKHLSTLPFAWKTWQKNENFNKDITRIETCCFPSFSPTHAAIHDFRLSRWLIVDVNLVLGF